jgi:bacterioferritin-associated ferredoxin
MIVCVCNGLKDSVCRRTAADRRCQGVACIYRLNGTRVRCGRCVPLMREIFAAQAPERLSGRRGTEPASGVTPDEIRARVGAPVEDLPGKTAA